MKLLIYFTLAMVAMLSVITSCSNTSDTNSTNNNNSSSSDSLKGHILRTTDGGINWEQVLFKSTSGTALDGPIQNITFCPPDHYIAIANGYVYYSNDFGAHWERRAANISSDFSAVSSGNHTNFALAVGESKMTASTTDGGQFWDQKSGGSSTDCFNVTMTSSSTAYACGEFGIMRSPNLGTSWTTLFSASDTYGVDGSGSVIIGGLDDGEIAYSTDAGATWTRRRIISSAETITSVKFEGDGKTVNILTDRGSIFHSTNAGSTWKDVSFGSSAIHYFDLENCGSTALVAVGSGKRIAKSRDNGATWYSVSPSISTNGTTFTSVAFENGNKGIVVIGK